MQSNLRSSSLCFAESCSGSRPRISRRRCETDLPASRRGPADSAGPRRARPQCLKPLMSSALSVVRHQLRAPSVLMCRRRMSWQVRRAQTAPVRQKRRVVQIPLILRGHLFLSPAVHRRRLTLVAAGNSEDAFISNSSRESSMVGHLLLLMCAWQRRYACLQRRLVQVSDESWPESVSPNNTYRCARQMTSRVRRMESSAAWAWIA